MRKVFFVFLIALLVTGFAAANSKEEDPFAIPDYSNDWQVGPAIATTPQCTEDFEAGIPGDWTVTDDVGDGFFWTNLAGTGCGECNYVNNSADVACASIDEFGSGFAFDTSLITPAYDFSASVNSGIEVEINYQWIFSDEFFYIDCTSDGGGTWTNLLTWNEDHGNFGCGGPGEFVSLDLSAYDGEAAVQCRFRYFSPVPHWSWFVQVDNFTLLSDGVIPDCSGGGDGGGDGGGVPATTGIGLALLVLALGGGSAYFLRRK